MIIQKVFFYIIFSFITFFCGKSQALNKLTYIDIIYLRTDRDIYNAGETIRFNAYCYSFDDSLQGSTLFVELIDTAFKKLSETLLPIINGNADGSISIPPNIVNGILFIRVFTDKAVAGSTGNQFIKPVFLNRDYTLKQQKGHGTVNVTFYPEGGNLVANAENYVAFKAAYQNHVPFFINGIVKTEEGEVVANASANDEGVGVFRFTPGSGKNHFLHWQDANHNNNVTQLPKTIDYGIALHVQQVKDNLYFIINNAGSADESLKKLTIKTTIDNKVIQEALIDMSAKNILSFPMSISGLPPAIATVRVFNKNNLQVAQRNVFINQNAAYENSTLTYVSKDLSARGRNHIRIDFKDSLLYQVSVSISDAEYISNNTASNIAGELLLNNFLATPLPDAGKYFTDTVNSKVLMQGLDLVLMTNELNFTQNTSSLLSNNFNHLQLKGTVLNSKGKAFAKKNIMVTLEIPGIQKDIFKLNTDSIGRFFLNNLIFYDSLLVSCRPLGSNENISCALQVDFPLKPASPEFSNEFKKRTKLIITRYNYPEGRVNQDIVNNFIDTLVFANNAVTLNEVIVSNDPAKMERKRLENLEKKHTTGAFSSYRATAYSVDVLNDEMADAYFDIYNYIAAKMPELRVILKGGNKELTLSRNQSSTDNFITDYYLNESKTDRGMIDQLTIKEIAFIKFIPQFGGLPGLPPVISIYLKKTGDIPFWEKEVATTRKQVVKGYPHVIGFFAPDYSKNKKNVLHDSRKTLYWNPHVDVINGKAEIEFYNNDNSKKLIVIVEGIAADGRLTHFKKIIE